MFVTLFPNILLWLCDLGKFFIKHDHGIIQNNMVLSNIFNLLLFHRSAKFIWWKYFKFGPWKRRNHFDRSNRYSYYRNVNNNQKWFKHYQQYFRWDHKTCGGGRDLSIIGLFLFTIPRIFNTKNDTIQYQKTIPPKNIFFKILLHFSPFQTILSIFWKSPFLGPKKAHIMGIWAENHPFGVFSYKCLELSN